MGPKKKQAPRNAFYFFMLDYKENAEMRGRSFPGGLKDVAEAASPSWKVRICRLVENKGGFKFLLLNTQFLNK